ncbi:MAG: glycoside hydrolase family protein [Alphaproteobacteria bacterium]
MKDTKLRNFLLGSILVGGLATGVAGCSQKGQGKDDNNTIKTEAGSAKPQKDTYGNVALFENSRSDIKFALAFVENYYPYIYWCGEAWTTGHGLTVLYNSNGTYNKVTKNTKVPTLEESDVFKGRYLTYEILPDIKNCITVPMDENTLIAACALRYCIGGANFKKSAFLKQLNAGKTGGALAKTLTGWRQQAGVPNRMYFFAALMCDEIKYADLLDLCAEGCYNLTYKDMFVYRNGQPKCDRKGFYEWDFSNIKENLHKAKQPRIVSLNLGKKKGHVKVKCEPVKEIVPEYIWQEVNDLAAREKHKNTSKTVGLIALGALGYGAYLYRRKKYMLQR